MKINVQLHRPQFLKSEDHPNLKAVGDNLQKASDKVRGFLGHPAADRLQSNEAPKAKDRTNRHRLLGSPLLTFTVGEEKIKSFKGFADNLRAAWDKTADLGGAKFQALAGAHASDKVDGLYTKGTYQAEKEALFLDAKSGLDAARKYKVATALECMNSLHNKEGHNKNTVSVTKALLDDPGIQALLQAVRIERRQKRSFSYHEVICAAQYHGLADRDIPVAVLAGQRKISETEKERWITPRSAKSAKIFDELNLGSKKASDLIRQTRVFGSESKSRPVEAQVLDLVDRLCGMGAKDGFKKKDGSGQVDVDQLFKVIGLNLKDEDVHIDPVLMAGVRQQVEAGMLDKALLVHRQNDGVVKIPA